MPVIPPFTQQNSLEFVNFYDSQKNLATDYEGDEQSVVAIHVRPTEYGFPAFAEGNRLVGFYREVKSNHTTDTLIFTPLHYIAAQKDNPVFSDDVTRISTIFIAATEKNPSEIAYKRDYITLERLKEFVILGAYSRSQSK
jgi:hypothetical protein